MCSSDLEHSRLEDLVTSLQRELEAERALRVKATQQLEVEQEELSARRRQGAKPAPATMFKMIKDMFATFRRQSQELDVIRAQRLKLQRQMETFKAESAEQLRQQEEQTLAMLEKVVERMQTERGRLSVDKKLMQTQIDAIEESLSGQLSQAMREKMENKLKEIELLAQSGELFDSQTVRKPRDTGR